MDDMALAASGYSAIREFMKKVTIEKETIHAKKDARDVIVSLFCPVWALDVALRDDYEVTLHTDNGDFKGSGKTPEEARAKAYAELRRRL